VRKKNILYWANYSSLGSTKSSCTGTTNPSNQPRKDPFHINSLLILPQSAGTTTLGCPEKVVYHGCHERLFAYQVAISGTLFPNHPNLK
jgi:hypothetical protein